MSEHEAIAITRNPWGHSDEYRRAAALMVCDRVEAWRDAYENMRGFAIQNGLDVTSYAEVKGDERA